MRELVLAEVAPKVHGLTPEGLTNEVKAALDRIIQREDVKISPRERRTFLQEMIQDTLGYGPLDPLLQDPSITEVMCNNFDDIWVERDGKLHHTGAAFGDEQQYRHVIEKIVSAVGRRIDESSPMVDARLPDGSRVNAILPPLAIHGPIMTIRKFAADPYTVKDLINFGTFTLDLSVVMEACVRGKLNILVSGRYRHRQDDQPQRAVVVHPRGRAHRHHRGRGRAPAPAAPHPEPRVPPAERGGRRRGQDPRPGPQRPSYASRPHHRR